MNKVMIILYVFFIASACAAPSVSTRNTETTAYIPASNMTTPERFNDADRDACAAVGGHYENAGLLGYFRCTMSYPDGGKVCSDNRDCQGACRVGEGTEVDYSGRTGGYSGVCQINDNPFGCHADIVNSIPRPPLCVD